ncbi:hypothetical protein PG984_006497 [Apiospora sp. TS-2023a]
MRNSLGLPAVRAHQDGSAFTAPSILLNPWIVENDKPAVLLDDSFDIAVHLDDAHGELYRLYSIIPGGSGYGSIALHYAFNSYVDELLTQYSLPLDPRTAKSDKATIISRFHKDGKIKEWGTLRCRWGRGAVS